jgi:hypothetical protein
VFRICCKFEVKLLRTMEKIDLTMRNFLPHNFLIFVILQKFFTLQLFNIFNFTESFVFSSNLMGFQSQEKYNSNSIFFHLTLDKQNGTRSFKRIVGIFGYRWSICTRLVSYILTHIPQYFSKINTFPYSVITIGANNLDF